MNLEGHVDISLVLRRERTGTCIYQKQQSKTGKKGSKTVRKKGSKKNRRPLGGGQGVKPRMGGGRDGWGR